MPEPEIKNFSTQAEWFYDNAPEGLFASPGWLSVISKCYGMDVRAVRLDEGGYLPFARIDDMLGKRLIFLPFSDYLDLAWPSPETIPVITKKLRAGFPDYSVLLKTDYDFKTGQKTALENTRRAVYHTIDLNEPVALSGSFRRGVRKAERSGVEIRKTRDRNAIDRFYRIYHQLRFEKFNILPQPREFFLEIWRQFMAEEKGFLLEALWREQVVASLIALTAGNKVYYKFGCSDANHLKLRPNNLLFYHLIRTARADGMDAIHLGLSGSSESYAGLRRWKESMGGTPHPITYWKKEARPARRKDPRIQSHLEQLTSAIVEADLDAEQTSRLSRYLYKFFA